MKNILKKIGIVLSFATIAPLAANYESSFFNECDKAVKDARKFAKDNPETATSMGIGASTGGGIALMKLFGKRSAPWRFVRGSFLGTLLGGAAYTSAQLATENFKQAESSKERERLKGVTYTIGGCVAALAALFCA